MTYQAPPRRPANSTATGKEDQQLHTWLSFHRATLLRKCDGLDGDALKSRPIATSDLSLLGLVRHMAAVEQYWLPHVFLGEDVNWYIDSSDDPDADFHDLDGIPVERVFDIFDESQRASDVIIASHSFDQPASNSGDTPRNLRWIVWHLVEEYARHNGHADIIRELIDGETGW